MTAVSIRRPVFRAVLTVIAIVVAVLAVVFAQSGAQAAKGEGPLSIRGGGTTIVEGGTGDPTFVPVITKFAFHWDGKHGALECLALAPDQPAGPGSGDFDTNVMYVTGEITSASIDKQGKTAVMKGTATVTGLGAGSDLPFTATVVAGGPGTTFVLEVSGFTFKESVLEGEIVF